MPCSDKERDSERTSYESRHPTVVRGMGVDDIRPELSDQPKEPYPGRKVPLAPEANRIHRKPLLLSPREDPAVLRGDEGCGVTVAPHASKFLHDSDLLAAPTVRALGVKNEWAMLRHASSCKPAK
jgi:hypothetical protein